MTTGSVARFLSKVIPRPNGCEEWTAGRGKGGYGKFKADGRTYLAHRWAYKTFVGPIPDGLTLDHLCRNRACVNPAHLEPVTMGENLLRGDTFQAANAAKTHCPQGHPLSGENLMRSGGRRYCRICARGRVATWRTANLDEVRRRDREAHKRRRDARRVV